MESANKRYLLRLTELLDEKAALERTLKDERNTTKEIELLSPSEKSRAEEGGN